MSDDDEGLDEVDPSILEAPYGRKDFLLDAAKLRPRRRRPARSSWRRSRRRQRPRRPRPGRRPDRDRRGQRGEAVLRHHLDDDRRGRPAGARRKNFAGPLWEKLTGIKIKVDRGAVRRSICTKAIAEHIAKSGAIDVDRRVARRWIPDFADRGVIIPIDDLRREVQGEGDRCNDLHPALPRARQVQGQDLGLLRRRRRLEPLLPQGHLRQPEAARRRTRRSSSATCARRGRGTSSPRRRSSSPTSSRRRSTAAARARALGNPGNQFYFFQQFRNFGGKFFDPKTMKAQINNAIGVKAMNIDHAGAQGLAARAVEKLDFVTHVGDVAAGQDGDDLRLAADRSHLRELRPARQGVLLPAQVEDRRQGRLRARCRAGTASTPAASSGASPPTRRTRRRAYLFSQWLTSPSISLQRVMLPYTLRDPYRISHYKSHAVPDSSGRRPRST